jgi:hypothetical protein
MKDGMYIIVQNYVEGESILTNTKITMEQLEAIEKIVGTDFIDDLTKENQISIKLITKEEHRESVINGYIFDGYSKKEAEELARGEFGDI